MNKSIRITLFTRTLALISGVLFSTSLYAQTITVTELSFNPVIDGLASEWTGIATTSVPLTQSRAGGKSDITSIDVKFGTAGGNVCFLFQWKDSSYDFQHKPYVWNEGSGKYETGPQREDRLAVQFAMEGDYDTNWLSGKEFKADIWHWKSARSNPAGLAQDKMTIVSKTKIKKAYEGKAQDGSTIYIKRPSDAGDKLYKTKRYATKEETIMPKYIAADNPQGSVADVKAKGVWANGSWVLEGCRKLNTGNADDIVFTKGTAVKGGIAVFNQSGDDDHNYSGNLVFQF